jgi:hypothetical protein
MMTTAEDRDEREHPRRIQDDTCHPQMPDEIEETGALPHFAVLQKGKQLLKLGEYDKAIPFLSRACHDWNAPGSAYAAMYLGVCYLEGSEHRDLIKAAQLFSRAVSQGCRPANSLLGYCYQCGVGVIKCNEYADIYFLGARGGRPDERDVYQDTVDSLQDTADAPQVGRKSLPDKYNKIIKLLAVEQARIYVRRGQNVLITVLNYSFAYLCEIASAAYKKVF